MKVITLSGDPHTGKTTTLKDLYLLLKAKGCVDILPPTNCPASPSDYEYYVKWNEKRIGIVTMGDYSNVIIWYLGVFFGRGADYLIIADSNSTTPFYILERHEVEYTKVHKHNIEEIGVENLIFDKIAYL